MKIQPIRTIPVKRPLLAPIANIVSVRVAVRPGQDDELVRHLLASQ